MDCFSVYFVSPIPTPASFLLLALTRVYRAFDVNSSKLYSKGNNILTIMQRQRIELCVFYVCVYVCSSLISHIHTESIQKRIDVDDMWNCFMMAFVIYTTRIVHKFWSWFQFNLKLDAQKIDKISFTPENFSMFLYRHTQTPLTNKRQTKNYPKLLTAVFFFFVSTNRQDFFFVLNWPVSTINWIVLMGKNAHIATSSKCGATVRQR